MKESVPGGHYRPAGAEICTKKDHRMKYEAPRIVSVVGALAAIHNQKQVSPISDGDPLMHTPTSYQSDE